MAQQTINLGTNANDKTGDTLRVGGAMINANFTELYGNVNNIRVVTGAAVNYAQPTQAEINTAVGLTAVAAGSGYIAFGAFSTGGSTRRYLLISDGVIWAYSSQFTYIP